MRNKYLITIAFLLLGGMVFAQSSLVVSSTHPGLTVHVKDAAGKIKQSLEGAEVKLIIRKDTVKMKTDNKGEAYYRGPFRAPIFKIVVSHPGYETQEAESRSPSSPTTVAGHPIYLKRK